MARKKPLLTPDLTQQIYKDIADLQALVGRLDQYEACGQDCSEFRALAHESLATLEAIVNRVIHGHPGPKVSG